MINIKEKTIAYFVLILGAVIAIYPLFSIVNLSLTSKSNNSKVQNEFLQSIGHCNLPSRKPRRAFRHAELAVDYRTNPTLRKLRTILRCGIFCNGGIDPH